MKLGVLVVGLVSAFCAVAQNTSTTNILNNTRSSSAPIAQVQRAVALPAQAGLASWYGETHRGRLMANGKRFDPDQLTAASWFYPLGTRVHVVLKTDPRVLNPQPPRSVWVTITDRGPHRRLVRDGRIIDLSYAVFRRLADPDLGLVEVFVYPEVRFQQIALRSPG